MATKNIVPRANGQGKLGTSSKGWLEGHFTDVTNASRTMICNIINDCWDDELLNIFDIPKEHVKNYKKYKK